MIVSVSFFLGCISTWRLSKFSSDSGRYPDKRILQSDWLRAIAYQSISIFISLKCLIFDSVLFSSVLNPLDIQETLLEINLSTFKIQKNIYKLPSRHFLVQKLLSRPYHFKFLRLSSTNFNWSIFEYLDPYESWWSAVISQQKERSKPFKNLDSRRF